MEITLPSGATVTVKDNMVPGDRFAVQDATELVIGEDGRSHISGAASAQWKAFLTRIITAWSFPVPIPAIAGPQVLDEYPNLEDDDDALQDALRARYERIVSRRRPTTPKQAAASTTPS